MIFEIIITIIIFLSLIISVQVFIDTNCVKIRTFTHSNTKASLKVCLLTDLHNNGDDYLNLKLSKVIDENKPDIIVMTGDVIDEHAKDINNIKKLIDNVQDYPLYYVNGNHELRNPDLYQELLEYIEVSKHTQRIDNGLLVIEVRNQKINLLGISDEDFEYTDNKIIDSLDSSTENLNTDYLTILLAHRPEKLPIYASYPIDIVFSGHAHAGQIALPFRSLVAPGQKLFPKYNKGKYVDKKTTMYLSSGLGESGIMLRYNTRREIYFVDIIKE